MLVLQDVLLDFFGAAIKAQDLLNHLSQMRLLARKVDAIMAAGRDPSRSFRLEAAGVPPPPKWGKDPRINWEVKDDAMLLLGVYYHGLGHWEEIIADDRLGLKDKLACVVAKENGATAKEEADKDKDKGLPKGKMEQIILVAVGADMDARMKFRNGAGTGMLACDWRSSHPVPCHQAKVSTHFAAYISASYSSILGRSWLSLMQLPSLQLHVC